MFSRWLTIDPAKSCLIIGPRRSGKTTYLKTAFPSFNYVTLDDLDYLEWAKNDPKGFINSLGKQVIIDEIQREPRLTIAVKYAIDSSDALFFMTGSSSIGLLDSAADTLAGRISLYQFPTVCWGEELGKPTHTIFTDKQTPPIIKEAQRQLQTAITYGQFPEVILQPTPPLKQTLLANYKNTYFIRDIMQLAHIEHQQGLLGIFHHIARSIGSPLETSNFARESGLSYPTAQKYLAILTQSQLVFKLYGYQYGPAKRYIKAAKTYFADNGIIHSLNIPLQEGQLLENFVIAELEKRRKLGLIKSAQFYYYKSVSGREIDLIFETDDYVLYAIEIKSTKKPSRKDIRSLVAFSQVHSDRAIRLILFYTGETYDIIDTVHLIPIAALFRGI